MKRLYTSQHSEIIDYTIEDNVLDAVDAYQQRLVKQIEVASLQVEDGHNKPYIRVVDAFNKRGQVRAKLEVDVMQGGHPRCRVSTRCSPFIQF